MTQAQVRVRKGWSLGSSFNIVVPIRTAAPTALVPPITPHVARAARKLIGVDRGGNRSLGDRRRQYLSAVLYAMAGDSEVITPE